MQLRVVNEELAFEVGFHGDRHVLALADFFLKHADSFIETGTLAGTTAAYVAQTYPVSVYSCEPDHGAWMAARARCEQYPNAEIENKHSPAFLYDLFRRLPDLTRKPTVFWLDAHGYGFQWPLLREIEFITSQFDSAVIMIDDFKIPGRPEFGFDAYDGQECSLNYILPTLNPRHEYSLILPMYSEKTSAFHGLRGVGTLAYGANKIELPTEVAAHFSVAPVTLSRSR